MKKPKDASTDSSTPFQSVEPISLDSVIGISEFDADLIHTHYTKESKALVLVLLIRKYDIAKEVCKEMVNQDMNHMWKYE